MAAGSTGARQRWKADRKNGDSAAHRHLHDRPQPAGLPGEAPARRGGRVVTDGALAASQAAQDPTVELQGTPFTTEYYGVAMKKDADDLVRRVNQVLEDYRKDGGWQASYEQVAVGELARTQALRAARTEVPAHRPGTRHARPTPTGGTPQREVIDGRHGPRRSGDGPGRGGPCAGAARRGARGDRDLAARPPGPRRPQTPEGAELTGTTQERWTSAEVSITLLWTYFDAYRMHCAPRDIRLRRRLVQPRGPAELRNR